MSKLSSALWRGAASIGVLGLGGLAAVASVVSAPEGAQSLEQSASALGDSHYTVAVDTSEVTLACPPTLVNPDDDAKELVTSDLLGSTTSRPESLAGGGSSVDLGAIRAGASLPEVLVTAAVSGKEWNALAAQPCVPPLTRQMLLGGATTVGEDTLLILTNPSSQPVKVSIAGFGGAGSLGEIAQPIVIPARSTQIWRPAIWFPDQERLALSLHASGFGVAAWLQSSGLDGEVTEGIATVAGTAPSLLQLFPSPGTGSVLYLANPSDDALAVSVSLVEDNGARPLGGTEDLVIDPGAVFSVSLAGIPKGGIAVGADSPIAAVIAQQDQGNPHPVVSGQKIGTRSLIAPVALAVDPWVPPVDELQETLTQQGLSDLSFTLDALVQTDSGLEYRSEDLDRWSGKHLGGETLAAALTIQGKSAGGPVGAVVGLGSFPLAATVREVTLVP